MFISQFWCGLILGVGSMVFALLILAYVAGRKKQK